MSERYATVAKVSELPPGAALEVWVGDLALILCNVSGVLYAIEGVCTHDGGLLEDGELDGCEIECPRHGGRFDVRNGAAVALPAMEPVRSFPLHVRGDQIVIALEDA